MNLIETNQEIWEMGGPGRIAQFGDASFLLPGKFFYESNMRNARICALCALSSPDRLRSRAGKRRAFYVENEEIRKGKRRFCLSQAEAAFSRLWEKIRR